MEQESEKVNPYVPSPSQQKNNYCTSATMIITEATYVTFIGEGHRSKNQL